MVWWWLGLLFAPDTWIDLEVVKASVIWVPSMKMYDNAQYGEDVINCRQRKPRSCPFLWISVMFKNYPDHRKYGIKQKRNIHTQWAYSGRFHSTDSLTTIMCIYRFQFSLWQFLTGDVAAQSRHHHRAKLSVGAGLPPTAFRDAVNSSSRRSRLLPAAGIISYHTAIWLYTPHPEGKCKYFHNATR